jgi:hypothetical protein
MRWGGIIIKSIKTWSELSTLPAEVNLPGLLRGMTENDDDEDFDLHFRDRWQVFG